MYIFLFKTKISTYAKLDMPVYTQQIHIKTNGFNDISDITGKVAQCVAQSGTQQGMVNVFINGSTAALTTIENESGVVADLQELFERLVPQTGEYRHNLRWGDGNGFSHLRACLFKPNLTIPVQNAQMTLGTWQQIVLLDFDNKSRNRSVIVQVIS